MRIKERVIADRMKFFTTVATLGFLCAISAGSMMSQTVATSKRSNQDLEQAAGAARERGDSVSSTKLYERALTHDPSWQEGWWYYGSLLYDQNQYPAAVNAFRKLLALNGKLGDARGMLGLSEYECKDYAKAYDDLQRATADGTELDASLRNVVDYHRALLLNVRGDSDASFMLLSSLFMKGVHSEDLQVALGLSLLRVPVYPYQLNPSRDALILDAGNVAAYMIQKQYEKAEIAFQRLLTQNPTTPFVHYAFGGMLATMGRDQDAEKQFRAETSVNPDSALAYMEWSFIESRAKRYPEALPLAKKAVELSGDSFLAHYLLGNDLLMTGDIAGSIPQLEAARRLAPEVPDIRYSLSRAYARMGKSALAKQEQSEFIALQRKNAIDRSKLQKMYPSAQAITGVAPTTPE